jgi:hypothetical protein
MDIDTKKYKIKGGTEKTEKKIITFKNSSIKFQVIKRLFLKKNYESSTATIRCR